MKKAIRILTTILVLSIITAVYCIAVAPMLEPVSKYKRVELSHFGLDLETQQVMTLFGPNDWETDSFRHFEINNTHVFFSDKAAISDNHINIDKCTIVIVTSNKPLKAIMIRCLGDIKLEFQYPISLLNHSNNRLLSGQLIGSIHVISKGDAETLSLETRDFSINKDLISTSANVYFKYGRTQGVGSGMQIQLINHGLYNSQNKNSSLGPISQKIDNITLQKLQRLTIFPPAKKGDVKQNNESDLFNSPVELRCDGPFVFDALNKCASFEQNVSLIQTVSNKVSNSIRCQDLKLFFSSAKENNVSEQNDNSNQDSESDDSLDEWNLQLERLEASGQMVVIEAPEYQTKIHAGKFVASLSPLSFELESSTQCELYYKNHHISTQNLVYTIGKKGELGTLDCSSGWISSQLEQSGKQIRARWSDRLRLEPDPNDPTESVVSVQGPALMELENNNEKEATIKADGFFFWLTQKNKTDNGFGEISLSRMQANQNVVLKSNPITAMVKKLQLWFEKSENDAELLKIREQGKEGNSQETLGIGAQASQQSLSQLASNSFLVTGDLLQGKILFEQGQLQIDELILKDDVRVVQNNPDGEGKLEMSGSRIQIFNLMLPSASASLFGPSAVIRYNNATLTGDVININRGINRIWIDSGGVALFKPKEDGSQDGGAVVGNDMQASQKTADSQQPVDTLHLAKITWSKSMVFQNDTLTFVGAVSLNRKDQLASCDSLSITLNKKIDFQNINSAELQNSLDVRYVVLNNSVELINQTTENGALAAKDTLTASKMTIDMKNQTFVAEGPGTAVTQRKINNGEQTAQDGSSDNNKQTADVAKDSPAALSLKPASSLINLSINFQKRLEGTFNPRTLQTFTFSGHLQAFYVPINEIGEEIKTVYFSKLPPQAFTLKCEQIEIQTDVNKIANGELLEVGTKGSSSTSRIDNSSFIASGSVALEGLVYKANAEKVTYEAKNGMVTLEGGQAPVQLFYQKVLGGHYNQASSSTIYYNTQTGAVKGEGIQDFSLFLTPKNNPEQ